MNMQRTGFWQSTSLALVLFTVFNLKVAAETILPAQDLTETGVNWSTSNDTNSQVNSFGVVADTEKGSVLKLDYNLGEGSWVAFTSPSFASTINLAALGDSLAFYLKGDGLANSVLVELKDVDDQVHKSVTITSKAANWTQHQLNLTSDFTYAFNTSNRDLGQGLDLSQIKSIGFTVEPVSGQGGRGTIAIDELVVTKLNIPSPTELVIDDAELPALNNLNSLVGVLGTATLSQVTSPTPFEGTYGRAISVTTVADSGGFEKIFYNDTSTTALDISSYSHLSFYIQVTTTVTSDIDILLKDNSLVEKKITVQDYFSGGIIPVGSWQQVLIPLTDFTLSNSMDLTNMGELLFYVPLNTTIYLDKITIQAIDSTYVLDSMDTYYEDSSWSPAQADRSTATLSTITGQQGNAIQMTYQFPNDFDGQWVNMNRSFALNVLNDNSNTFQFDYKGSDGNNDIEFKVFDDNDTVYRFVLDKGTDTRSVWKTLLVPYQDMAYFSGTDKTFNFEKVTKIEFAIAKDSGGTGEFYVDSIQYIQKADFELAIPSGRLISNFSINNNPFAPSTSRPDSQAVFSFTLAEPAKVWLKFYDLNGNTILKIEETLGGGNQSLTWTGLNRHNKLVHNGLYIYQFVAKSETSGTTQKIKNIIGVIR